MTRQLSLRDIAFDLGTGSTELGVGVGRFLGTLERPPVLLGLGEPTHGVEAFPQLRNQLLAYLVEQQGYRAIALESDCLAAVVVDDYVRTGAGDLEQVLATGFSHGFGAAPANRELVTWLREHNAGRDPRDRVRFYGFDAPLEMAAAPSPRAALLGAHEYLREHLPAGRVPHDRDTLDALLGADADWPNPAAMYDAADSIGDTDNARALRLAADDIVARFEAHAPGLRQASSDNDFERALMLARAAHGLLRYHAEMAKPGPERFSLLTGLRDAMMAENLLAIARVQAHHGPCLVFAQNAHLRRTESAMRFGGMDVHWWSAGALTAPVLDSGYAFIALDCDRWVDNPAVQRQPHDFQAVLGDATASRALFPARPLAAALAGQAVSARVSDDQRYAPFDPAGLDGADAIVLLESI